MDWEVVIGLEVHVQLTTQSKIFSGSATRFGAEPNCQASAVDLGLPGTLPVFNEGALQKAVMLGLAIGATVHKRSVFDRKNYFYPDLPKGYQISQLAHPIVEHGHLDILLEDGTEKRIGITRAHLEEDAGKSIHDRFPGATAIDLNRAGTPLLEIVSEPDLRSAAEAVAYLRKLHAIVTCLEICDGDMSQGSMRCDCNVSLRPRGSQTLGTRTEIKNVNSFRFVEKAILSEIERQQDLLEDGVGITQETRLYDPDRDETRSMRGKEEAMDYRYFPDPDLLPIEIDEAYIDSIRRSLPELPESRKRRFVENFGLSLYDATNLTASRALSDYFEACAVKSGEAKLAANWIMGEMAKSLNQQGLDISQAPIPAESLAQLIRRIADKTLSGKLAKTVFEALWAEDEKDVDAIIDARGLRQVTDSGAIEKMVDEVLSANSSQVGQYLGASPEKRGKMLGFFVGQIMKASRGKANPQQVNQILQSKLQAMLDSSRDDPD